MRSPDATPTRGRSLRSTISSGGELRLELAERDVPEPGGSDVVVAVEASPVNPSDLGVLLGAVASGTLRRGGPHLVGLVPELTLPGYRDRLDKSLPVGNEGRRHRDRGGPGSGRVDRPSGGAVRRVDVG
jgi:NADPH:quinone reductase